MAKLSAHGTEIARVKVTLSYPLDSDVDWERNEFSYRTDGHILKRTITHWRRGALAGEQHDYGWKLHKKFVSATSRDNIFQAAQRHHDRLAERDGELPDISLDVEISR